MVGSRDRRARDRANRTTRTGEAEAESANSTPSVQNRAPSAGRNNEAAPPPPPPPPPDANQLMQTFLAGIAQVTAQMANGGGNHNPVHADPFLSALREFERHRTPRFDGSGGYAVAEDWLGGVVILQLRNIA